MNPAIIHAHTDKGVDMYVLRVRVASNWADIPFHANSLDQAIRICEAQYGSGSFLAVIEG